MSNPDTALPYPVQQPSGRETLSDEQTYALLSSVGNHEGKALLLIAMANGPEDKTYGRVQLHDLITKLPGTEDLYKGNQGNQMDWCNMSLAPIGMVAKSDYVNPLTYSITEEGRKLGKPLAGAMLDFSARHSISLLSLLGTTHSRSSVRSPETRLKIARALLADPEALSLQQLSGFLRDEKGSRLTSQLSSLSASGLLEYASKDLNTELPTFSLKNDAYSPLSRGLFAPLIVEFLRKNAEATTRDIAAYIIEQQLPELQGVSEAKIRGTVHTGLYALKGRGVIAQSSLRRAGTHGLVSLNDQQREMWQDLVSVVDAFQTLDPEVLAVYDQLADDFINDPAKVHAAMQRVLEASYSENGTEKRASVLVRHALSTSVGALSVRDLVELINNQHGRTLSDQTVRTVLQPLVEAGDVTREPGIQKPLYTLTERVTSTG